MKCLAEESTRVSQVCLDLSTETVQFRDRSDVTACVMIEEEMRREREEKRLRSATGFCLMKICVLPMDRYDRSLRMSLC